MSNNAKKKNTYLDLDDLSMETEFIIKMNGKEHKMRSATVMDFIENTKAVQNMPVEAGLEQEVDVIIGILTRAFPTITAEEFKKLELVKLNAILEMTRTANGEKQVADAIADESSNSGN
jgi:hypothetical protein